MISKSRFLYPVLFLSFFTLTPWSSAIVAKPGDCQNQIIDLIDQTEKDDWQKIPPSLTSIGVSNLALLFGVEGARDLMGWNAAFSHGFWVNTAIDPIITVLSHVIATNPPPFIRSFLSGPQTYLRRASFNTVLNAAVVLSLWQVGAAAQPNVDVTAQEATAAFGLCATYYFCIQYVKNKLFVELPRRFDEKVLAKMRQDLGEPVTALLQKAAERSDRIEIDRHQVETLFLSALESAVFRIPFEERISEISELTSNPKIQKLLRKIEEVIEGKRKQSLRKQLVFEALKHHKNLSAHEREKVFALGDPLTSEQSIQVLETLKARSWRNKTLVWLAAVGDQSIGVILAGGILLRGLTEWAMTPGNPSFMSTFLGGP